MEDFIQLLETLPSFLWFAIIVFLIVRYRSSADALLGRLTAFKGLGLEIEFAKQALDEAAARTAENDPDSTLSNAIRVSRDFAPVEISNEDKRNVLNRAAKNQLILRDSRILWVDDNPRNNVNERRMFRQLGVTTTAVTSTEQAQIELKNNEPMYDLVISDMKRGRDATAGIDFLRKYKADGGVLPVIFYIAHKDPSLPIPQGAFRLTNRPDELLGFVIDALELRVPS